MREEAPNLRGVPGLGTEDVPGQRAGLRERPAGRAESEAVEDGRVAAEAPRVRKGASEGTKRGRTSQETTHLASGTRSSRDCLRDCTAEFSDAHAVRRLEPSGDVSFLNLPHPLHLRLAKARKYNRT